MPEENKNLENTKRNLVSWIGVALFIMGIVSLIVASFTMPTNGWDKNLAYLLLVIYIIVPLTILGIIFILLGFLLKIKQIQKKVILILILLAIFWATSQFYIPKLFIGPFRLLAIAAKNEFICTIMPTVHHDFKNDCIREVAILKKNIAICDKITNYIRDECYVDLAEITKNETICERINDQVWQEICFFRMAVLKQESSFCEKIKYNQTDCYFEIAVKKKDSDLCEKIKTESENGKYIQGECYFTIARERRNPSLCGKIKYKFWQDNCNAEFSY